MTETNSAQFTCLFELRILHHYWLDVGANLFDNLPLSEKNKKLSNYRLNNFLKIAPSESSQKYLAKYGCLFRETTMGCVVLAPANAKLPLDAYLQFSVECVNSDFYNYSSLTLDSQPILEIFNNIDNKIYRYKKGAFVVSNIAGSKRTINASQNLFLSTEYASLPGVERVEYLYEQGGALVQLSADDSAAPQELHSDISKAPVYLNQEDAPTLIPPVGVVACPARGVLLNDDIPDNAFLLIRLSAINNSDSDFSLVENSGLPKVTHPVFQVRLKNRSTVWKYIKSQSGLVDFIEPNPLPLTFWGNAGSKQKPLVAPLKINQVANKISQLVSEVFI